MAEYQSNLYKRVKPSDELGADILMPNKGGDIGSAGEFTPPDDIQTKWPSKDRPNKDSFGLVDIFNDYTWTLSPLKARQQVPKIELVEYKLVLSSEISGALYTLLGYEDDVNVIARQAGQTIQDLTGAGLSTAQTLKKRALSNPVTSTIANKINNSSSSFFNNVGGGIDKFKDSLTSLLPKPAGTPNSGSLQSTKANDMSSQSQSRDSELDPYIGLYAIEPTGWVYNMPYFGAANMLSPNNSWGESTVLNAAKDKLLNSYSYIPGAGTPGKPTPPKASTSGGGITDKLDFKPLDFLSALRDMGLAGSGGLITKEVPQSFTGTDKDSITVSFYLLNTYKFEDIRRNWEFCFLFTYQNLANRKGINLLDPPSVYRILIPGYKQLPIGWLTNLSIQNVGTTRLINIVEPYAPVSGDAITPNIKMIPEAYKVSFTIQSGLFNARNLFSFAENPSRVVNVRMA